eukprot:5421649-Alexandrium_andersonii.AAC.1
MSASLVGSEMCIRDRQSTRRNNKGADILRDVLELAWELPCDVAPMGETCLLYTSDAADDM